jgi:endonuclease YncB( thermonuclease family)
LVLYLTYRRFPLPVNKRHTSILLVSTVLIALSYATIATGQVSRSISGHVLDVFDGDTITVIDGDRTEWKVKLAAIDAPELGQSFGKKARKELLELILDRPVTVSFDRTEGGDRIVGTVKLESQREILVAVFPININQYLVSQGFAWYDKSFEREQTSDERQLYSKLEAEARSGKKGLWAEKNPIPPWEFRGKSTLTIEPVAAPANSAPAVIIANKISRLYYLSYCPDYGKVPSKDQVNFKSASDAQAAGFKLAKSCELK